MIYIFIINYFSFQTVFINQRRQFTYRAGFFACGKLADSIDTDQSAVTVFGL